jgi:hypothetical protein
MLVWLASAFAAGPDVVGLGGEPSGADGLGCDADVVRGALALVPGPASVVDPRDGELAELGAVVVELDAVIGWLVANVAGPALPPVADADPPAVEAPWASGRASGWAVSIGLSARAGAPQSARSAMTAMSSISFFIS